ncbi:hypothetical protein TetV_573 [Tetraselmis virus 1]|uniref:Uncharacterized protein n=1 Tax=Tetraselmis virus 1 TaxID=2060617 RepID=A0A2P0VP28_9VIRU|nr:hypothetical protein QJ968_gp481 [Tetraselmis virus 1]AUF82655.1 hypothetical protein TetV_573 [Tetraselmis virus 1]
MITSGDFLISMKMTNSSNHVTWGKTKSKKKNRNRISALFVIGLIMVALYYVTSKN